MRRASDWELRVMHEAQQWQQNCFITLTYGRDKLPPNASLSHRDFQLFMKRARKAIGPFRFYMCGEYGPLNNRPHYHACLFGIDFTDRTPSGRSKSGRLFYNSQLLHDLWTHGIVTVQDLTRETASYTARYVMQKLTGDQATEAYTNTNRIPPYNAMSLKPGIGHDWFHQYRSDVFPHDYVATNDGRTRTVPRYYDRLAKRLDAIAHEQIQYQRTLEARKHYKDQTDERLRVREQVHNAKVSTLKRDLT